MHTQNRRHFNLGVEPTQYAVELRQVGYFLQRRWLTIASIVTLCLILGATVYMASERQFTASAQILFTPPRDRTIGSEGALLQSPIDAAALESQISLIRSTILLQQVVESEGLAQDEEFLRGLPTSIMGRLQSLFETSSVDASTPPNRSELALAVLRLRLNVSRVPNSYGVNVSIALPDPAKAARLANAVANSYISDRLSTRLGDTQRSVRLINPATPPAVPSHPKFMLILVSALCGGLFLGLGAAFSFEVFAVGFVTPQQIESALGIPVISMLPKLTAKDCRPFSDTVDAQRLLVIKPFARFSESIRSLRNIVQMGAADRRAKVIEITSAVPDEGKTTVAMCLAISAATSGQSVVIIDADLRRAKVTSHFELGTSVGLTDLLDDTATLEDAIRIDPKYGLRILPAGRRTDDPPKLLSTPAMKDLLKKLSEQFDLVVIDSPPLDPVIDALMIAGLADYVVLVVKWNHTPQSVVKQTFKLLWSETENIGAVLNFIDSKRAIGYDRYAYMRLDSKSYRNYYYE